MEIRPIEAGDEPALSRFFERIPESDRTFFKEDVSDPRVLDDWVQPGTGRTIAIDDGAVVGALAVMRLVGWSSHVGEVRLVVDPDHRGHGNRADDRGGSRRWVSRMKCSSASSTA